MKKDPRFVEVILGESRRIVRIAQIAGVHIARTGAAMPEVQAASDPQSIAAAAKAFTERARARVKGLAA